MIYKRRLMIMFSVLLVITAITYHTLASTYPSYDTEGDCRSCHWITLDRHHLLVQNGTFQCTDCHEMKWDDLNQSYYPEVIRNCMTCHPYKNHTETHHRLVEQGLYECTDCHPVKWNNDTQQYYIEVIWDCTVCHITVISTPTPTASPTPAPIPTASPTPPPTPIYAPTGAHASIDCSICHIQRPVEEICYQCHNNSANSYHGINIHAQFTMVNDSFAGMGASKGYYNKVNTRHDISDADQKNSSTRLECTTCHNAHIASRKNITIDPEDKSPFNRTLIHSGTGELLIDSITFCLKCHDNTWPMNVTGPSVMKNVSKTYIDPSRKGDEHGAASGSNKSVLIGPYASRGRSISVPAMPCSDCHDLHGNGGLYHLKTLTDQYGVPITITSQNIKSHVVAHWCSHCHKNPMNQLDGKNDRCLSSTCHTHGTKSF